MKQNQDLMKQSQDLMKNLNEKDLFIDRMATEHRNDRLGINTRLDSLIESQRSMVNRIVQGQRTIMSTLDGGIEAVRDRLGNIEARLTTHPESTAKVHGFGIVHQRSCNGGNFVRFISGQEQYVRRQLRRRVPQETRHNRVLRNFTPHANGINTRNILASIANRQIRVRSQVPVPSTIQTHRCSKRKLEEEGQSSDASLLVGTIPKISRLKTTKTSL
ncbi:unnamed protein product [Albugo candida]|uniref:Uncharacterized protein n=1 Tax=Albugo candida TaxID=65357 RepID=A0A024FVN0_9STRA|nr:unnamed protein product [Albugo candida]|eukprot:CCI10719.1 unnamed protein product [Albugo candida]